MIMIKCKHCGIGFAPPEGTEALEDAIEAHMLKHHTDKVLLPHGADFWREQVIVS